MFPGKILLVLGFTGQIGFVEILLFLPFLLIIIILIEIIVWLAKKIRRE